MFAWAWPIADTPPPHTPDGHPMSSQTCINVFCKVHKGILEPLLEDTATSKALHSPKTWL